MARRTFILISLFLSLFLLGGCLSGCVACEAGSLFADRGVDHCYQKLAVMTGDASGCEKIPGTGFEGSNPPKDKCYLLVAEKNVDPAPCANIEGGMNSYTTDECYQSVGATGGSADQCDGLTGGAEIECRTGVARGQSSEGLVPSCGAGYTWAAGGLGGGSCVKAPETEKPTTADKETTTTTTSTSKAGTAGTTSTSEKETETTTADKPTTTTTSTKTTTTTSTKETTTPTTGTTKDSDSPLGTDKDVTDTRSPKEKVADVFTDVKKNPDPTPEQEQGSRLSDQLDDVEDDAEKAEIVKEFLKQREARDARTLAEQQKLLDAIKAQHAKNKELDDLANTIKSDTYDKAKDAVTDAASDAAKEKMKDLATGWIDKNAPPKAKEALGKASAAYGKAKEKMDKLGEKFDKAKGYYDKVKGVYDEVKDVTDKIDRIQDKVSQGKIDEKRGKVLKGGVLLGKGLEHATSYIPVLGDTASKVTKETFGVAISVAEKKAERSTKLDDCFTDPLNCDTDGISGY